MTPTAGVQADAPTLRVACLLAAFASALALRLAVGGPGAPQSPTAGLVFAGCLLAVTAAAGTRIPISRRAVRTGLAGGGGRWCVRRSCCRTCSSCDRRTTRPASGRGRWW